MSVSTIEALGNYYGIGFLLSSLCVGSFIGVVVARLPQGGNPLWGRSACPLCGETLGAFELMPVISWLALRGRCRHCGGRISAFYPATELAAALIALWAATAVSDCWATVAGTLLGWQLLTLGLVDWQTMLLPRVLTYLLVTTGLGVGTLLSGWPPSDHLIGGLLGYASFHLAAVTYRRVRGREGLGSGDAKLMAGLGAWVGWQGLPTVIVYAAWLALALVAWRRLRGMTITSQTAIPFGPFLALGGWLVWLYGPLAFQASSR